MGAGASLVLSGYSPETLLNEYEGLVRGGIPDNALEKALRYEIERRLKAHKLLVQEGAVAHRDEARLTEDLTPLRRPRACRPGSRPGRRSFFHH